MGQDTLLLIIMLCDADLRAKESDDVREGMKTFTVGELSGLYEEYAVGHVHL